MAKYRLEFEADWSSRKVKSAAMILRRELAFLRGVKHVVPLHEIGKEELARPRLRLRCTRNAYGHGRCNTEWMADVFTPCPKCKQRNWVTKIEAA